jgi:hypothetical protein
VKEYLLKKTRRILTVLGLAAALTIGVAGSALAGSPHFVDDQTTLSQSGNTLTVSGKEAGLGDETQVHVVLTADAACVNPGDNKPQAENKQDVLAAGDFPVQNGKAYFTLSGTAVFDPSSPCPDPMTVEYSNVTVTDTTNGISLTL